MSRLTSQHQLREHIRPLCRRRHRDIPPRLLLLRPRLLVLPIYRPPSRTLTVNEYPTRASVPPFVVGPVDGKFLRGVSVGTRPKAFREGGVKGSDD